MSYYAQSKFVEDPNTPWYKVLELIPYGCKVLDVGCSSGNFGKTIIERKSAIVDGIELDKKDSEIAQKKLRKVFNINIETDNLNAIDNDYDVIYFGDVIEHLVSPSKTLVKVKRFLSKSGFVVFSIPNMAHISVRMMLLNGAFEYGETGLLDKTHLHFYDRTEVERVFNDAGYTINRFDLVTRDMPKELLQTDLAKVGLIGSKKFFEAAKSVEYTAYQFIGTAKPSGDIQTITQRKLLSPPIDRYEKHLKAIRKSYESEISKLHNEYSEKIRTDRKIYEDHLLAYEKSLSWKITKPIRGLNRSLGIAKKNDKKLN